MLSNVEKISVDFSLTHSLSSSYKVVFGTRWSASPLPPLENCPAGRWATHPNGLSLLITHFKLFIYWSTLNCISFQSLDIKLCTVINWSYQTIKTPLTLSLVRIIYILFVIYIYFMYVISYIFHYVQSQIINHFPRINYAISFPSPL